LSGQSVTNFKTAVAEGLFRAPLLPNSGQPAQFQTVFNANFQSKDFVSQKTHIVPQWAVNSFLRGGRIL
jgi:hypothetical protein